MEKIAHNILNKMSAEELEAEIRRHNRLYFEENRPEISDDDFDRLVERLKKLKPKSPVLSEVGSDLRKGVVVPKIAHESPMLSLDKCYNVEDLMIWAEKFEGAVIATPKIDGAAVEIRYGPDGNILVAATRGDGMKGEDITANVRHVADVPQRIREKGIEVRGEIYMPLSVFKDFKEEFANPRNLAAGAIKQKLPRKTREYRLSFFAYDIRNKSFALESEKIELLKKLGFNTIPAKTLKTQKDLLQGEWERLLAARGRLDYEVDGVVFKVDRIDEQERLGASSHHPRWAIAYKFQGDSGTTTLRKVDWSVARTGVITPIGLVDPVELSGASVSRVSLHNYGMVKKLGVTVPAKVAMIRAGGVIPYLEKVLERQGKPVTAPTKCPSCGFPTQIRDDFLYCTNARGCRQAKMGELMHFVRVAEIDGFGDVLIEKLYENAFVEDPADFFDLTEKDLLSFERMGEILAKKLIGNIQSRRKMPLENFLQALGIRELARHSSKVLVNEFGSLERIRGATEEEISAIHTIGPVIAREVVAGLKEKKGLIDKLLKRVKVDEKPAAKKGPLQGKTFLFTGTLASMERSEAEKKVGDAGGEVASGVTKTLDFLVIGSEGYKNREKGNKWVKAEKLIEKGAKIQIISEEDFLKKVKG